MTVIELDQPRLIEESRTRGDRIFRRLAMGAGFSTFAIMGLIALFLVLESLPALRQMGLRFFTETDWQFPAELQAGQTAPPFGVAAILFWTVVNAIIALVIAVPVSIATALFINEYAPARVRRYLTTLVDLLAAVPSLIFGLWGLFFLQPNMLGLSEWIATHLGFVPLFDAPDDAIYASSALICGVVLALMITPIITSVTREVFSQVPPFEKEAALALGGTRWGMIRTVVLPFGRGGIIGGSMLGLGRALGETIAVAIIASTIFDIRWPIITFGTNGIAPNIALRFGEARGVEPSALMASGLTLFALTLAVNALATVVVSRSRSGAGVEI